MAVKNPFDGIIALNCSQAAWNAVSLSRTPGISETVAANMDQSTFCDEAYVSDACFNSAKKR